MIELYVQGKIVSYDPITGSMIIHAVYENLDDMLRKGYSDVEVRLEDGRTITSDQRRKAYALEGDIGRWAGYITKEDKIELHDVLKQMHVDKNLVEWFSLSDCSITTAREYINTLVDFVLENNVPCIDLVLNRTDDIDAYLYSCLWYRRCAVCGRDADIHHMDRVGMGRNRDTISHIGMRAMALCREHHQEAHQRGQNLFNDHYHLYGIKIDDVLARRLRLGVDGKA